MAFCPKCGTGFDSTRDSHCPGCGHDVRLSPLSSGPAPAVTLADVNQPLLRPSPITESSGLAIGNFFLITGAFITLLVCAFTVLTTVYGIWEIKQVFPLVTISTGDSILLRGVVLLDGMVKFCFSAALFVVFVRVWERG